MSTITDNGELLGKVRDMTQDIRTLQSQIKERGKERREFIVNLRSNGVTYREIAENMGVTEQNVYKILHRSSV